MSVDYINNHMPVFPDWYVCTSIALDADEEEWYNRQYLAWVTSGNDPKKFPKRKLPYTEPVQETRNVQDMVVNALSMGKVKMDARKGDINEYARAKKLQKVYQMPDGTFVDEHGERVEPQAGSVFVKSKGDH